MVTHWLLHTRVQILCLVLVHKKVWCCLSSLSIQTRVFAVIFCITLLLQNVPIQLASHLDVLYLVEFSIEI